MIKRQLNPLRIGKGLLSLVALFMMLLTPQRAWADGLGLTIAGVTVTSENASNITNANFSAFNGGEYVISYSNGVLTLQNARIEGSGCFIEWSNNSDLTIEFSGYNSIDNQDWEVGAISAIKSTTTGHKLILKKKEGATEASLSLGSTLKGTDNADLSDVAIISGFTGGVSATGLVSSENSGSNSSSPVYTNKTITYTYTAPTDYNLLINEIQVTSENFNNITGTGIYSEANSVSYNPTTKTLTLSGASINGSIKRTDNTDLTIHLVGNNNNIFWDQTKNIPLFIGNGGALKITTDATTPGSLDINGTSKGTDFASGFNTTNSTLIWHDGLDDDVAPTSVWYLDQGCDFMTLKTNNNLYDLWIKESTLNDSVQFCDALLSYYGGVTFEPASSTLSLREHSEDEQPFSPYSFTSKLSALTVSVSGNVTMNSFHYVKVQGQQGTLTIEKFGNSSADVNALTLSDDDGVITGFKTVTIVSPLQIMSPATEPEQWDDNITSAIITDTYETPTIKFTNGYEYEYSNGEVFSTIYGDTEYPFTKPTLVVSPNTLKVIYSSSNTDVATVDDEGNLNILTAGITTITATTEATGTYASASRSYVIHVQPKIVFSPSYNIRFPGQTVTLSTLPEGAAIKYSLNGGTSTDYTAPIEMTSNLISNHGFYISATASLGEGDDKVENSVSERYFVYGQPVFSPEPGSYNDALEVEITNLPEVRTTVEDISYAHVCYGFDDDQDYTIYQAGTKIHVQESSTLKVYILDEDSGKVYKSEVVEAQYNIRQDPGLAYLKDGEYVEVVEYIIGENNDELPTLANEYELPVTYLSSNINVATVDNEGNVDIVGVGETDIAASSEATDDLQAGYASYPLIVYKNLNHSSISITIDNATYTGEAIEPTVIVKDGEGDITEFVNVAYSNNTNVGTNATVTITPKELETENYYKGSATKSFTISKAPLENLSVSLEGWTYGETANTPTVTGNTGNGTVTYSYKGVNDEAFSETVPENAGDYTIKVEVAETDNYASGSATADFTIEKADITLTVSLDGWTYGETANTPTVTGNTGEGTVTYTYKGANDETFSTTVPTYAGTHTIKATVGETTNYNSDEATSTFTIAKADMSMVSVSYEDLVYNGEAQQLFTVNNVPENATVKYICQETDDPNEMICDPNENQYSTTVPSATEVGYYAIFYKIEGTNNYNGTQASKTYCVQIVPAEITSMTLDKESLSYTGTAQTVTITSVKAGDLTLGAADYTVTLNGEAVTGDIQATDVGEYTVEVTGKGNFTGSESAAFTIVNRTLADNEVTFYNNWATYYSAVGDVMLPTDKNIGAFVATGIGDGVVSVSQISYIPKNVPVFLNNATENVSTVVFDKDKDTNLLEHTDKTINANTVDAVYYGLHNGKLMRVSGTIPAGKNYIKILTAVNNQPQAPELSLVFEGETTGIGASLVNSEQRIVNGDVYDLQGRKMQKLSKKGLYISNGRKVVVK